MSSFSGNSSVAGESMASGREESFVTPDDADGNG